MSDVRRPMLRRVILLWLAIMLGALAAAQLLFTGQHTSEVAGNLAFALLVLCFPSSLAAYPLAVAVAAAFESHGLFPYNDRLVLSIWWLVFFVCGLAQWGLLLLLVSRRKTSKLVRLRSQNDASA